MLLPALMLLEIGGFSFAGVLASPPVSFAQE